jgi:hypothetical protein
LEHFGGLLVSRLTGCAHHVQSTRGVDVDHPDSESSGRANRASHRVRDVVKLEVEKDAVAPADEFLNQPRTVAGEKAAANFEAADEPTQSIRERSRIVYGVDIECDE